MRKPSKNSHVKRGGSNGLIFLTSYQTWWFWRCHHGCVGWISLLLLTNIFTACFNSCHYKASGHGSLSNYGRVQASISNLSQFQFNTNIIGGSLHGYTWSPITRELFVIMYCPLVFFQMHVSFTNVLIFQDMDMIHT